MRWMLILLCGCTLWASPIPKTIDQLLDNEDKTEIEVPQYDPFKRATPLLHKKSKRIKVHKALPTQLVAVLNDKAFINGKWYKKGDVLSEGKIVDVRADSVYLKKGHKIKILKLKKTKSIFTLDQKETR